MSESKTHRLYVYRVKSKTKVQKGSKSYFEERFIKIGLTSQAKITDRFDKFPDGFVEHYSKSLLTSQKFETRQQVFVAEQDLHKALQKFRYYPKHKFSGHTECYISTPDSIKMIKSLIWATRIKFTPNTKVLKSVSESTKRKAFAVSKSLSNRGDSPKQV